MASENRTNEEKRLPSFSELSRFIRFILTAALLLVVLCFIWRLSFDSRQENQTPTVETSSRLEKTLRINELSTYQVTFNGVATVRDDAGSILYYAAYNARVSIGLDMEKITVSMKDMDAGTENNSGRTSGKKQLIVTLPAAKITDIAVDPGSLDYIFKDSSADNEHVSITALPACKADAEAECMSNQMIFELAKENAVNTVRALTQPFLDQNKDYSLVITGGEGGLQ